MSSWSVLTNWISTRVHTMPSEYILPLTRYDNPNAMPNGNNISGWFCDGCIVYANARYKKARANYNIASYNNAS